MELEKLGQYHLCQTAEGHPVEFHAPTAEVACLAFDGQRGQLVELHVLARSDGWGAAQVQSFQERINLLRGVNSAVVPRLLDAGILEGLAYYSSTLEPGESASTYVGRLGALPEAIAVQLCYSLCLQLIALQQFPRIFRHCSLKNLLLLGAESTVGVPLLQLRDLGLCEGERRGVDDAAEERLARELGELVYLLLTGHESGHGNGPVPDCVFLLERCPDLRAFVKAALGFGGGVGRGSLAAGMLALRRAAELFSASAASAALPSPPLIPWRRVLFEREHFQSLLPAQFSVRRGGFPEVEPLSCRVVEGTARKSFLLHPLPAERIVPVGPCRRVPEQIAKVDREAHPNLLFPHSTWSGPQLTFLLENGANSFSLNQLLEIRKSLPPKEAAQLLRDVLAGLQQSERSGIPLPGLHPVDALVVFSDEPEEAALRVRMRQAVEDWPSFIVKIRVHTTCRTLVEPVLDVCSSVRSIHRMRRLEEAFFSLAAFLVGGVGNLSQSGLPKPLIDFFQQGLISVRRGDSVPAPERVVEAFEAVSPPKAASNRLPLLTEKPGQLVQDESIQRSHLAPMAHGNGNGHTDGQGNGDSHGHAQPSPRVKGIEELPNGHPPTEQPKLLVSVAVTSAVLATEEPSSSAASVTYEIGTASVPSCLFVAPSREAKAVAANSPEETVSISPKDSSPVGEMVVPAISSRSESASKEVELSNESDVAAAPFTFESQVDTKHLYAEKAAAVAVYAASESPAVETEERILPLTPGAIAQEILSRRHGRESAFQRTEPKVDEAGDEEYEDCSDVFASEFELLARLETVEDAAEMLEADPDSLLGGAKEKETGAEGGAAQEGWADRLSEISASAETETTPVPIAESEPSAPEVALFARSHVPLPAVMSPELRDRDVQLAPATVPPRAEVEPMSGVSPFPVESLNETAVQPTVEPAVVPPELDPNAPEGAAVPTLSLDLARLTTADSLFTRRGRVATIRNN